MQCQINFASIRQPSSMCCFHKNGGCWRLQKKDHHKESCNCPVKQGHRNFIGTMSRIIHSMVFRACKIVGRNQSDVRCGLNLKSWHKRWEFWFFPAILKRSSNGFKINLRGAEKHWNRYDYEKNLPVLKINDAVLCQNLGCRSNSFCGYKRGFRNCWNLF